MDTASQMDQEMATANSQEKVERVLVSGAGVAGLAVAMWLARGGVDVIVVEKAKSARIGGYLVGLAGQAYQDALDLDVMSALRARDGEIARSRYLDTKGKALLNLDYGRLFNGVDIIQLMRDDLVDGVIEKAKDQADIRFGESIAALSQDSNGVDVTFASGKSDRFDAVIGADGQNSNTRKLVFNNKAVQFRHLGLMCAAYRLPNVLGIKKIFETHMERHRYMNVFTTRHGDLGAIFVWQSNEETAPTQSERYRLLTAAYDFPPTATGLVIGQCPIDGQFYMDPTIQVAMQRWHEGRVVLVGDAAHALTLFSGRGAAAAFTDAGFLGRAMTSMPVDQAFRAYEHARLQPVSDIQNATQGAVDWYVPRSWHRYLIRNGAMALLPNRLFEAYFHHKYSTV